MSQSDFDVNLPLAHINSVKKESYDFGTSQSSKTSTSYASFIEQISPDAKNPDGINNLEVTCPICGENISFDVDIRNVVLVPASKVTANGKLHRKMWKKSYQRERIISLVIFGMGLIYLFSEVLSKFNQDSPANFHELIALAFTCVIMLITSVFYIDWWRKSIEIRRGDRDFLVSGSVMNRLSLPYLDWMDKVAIVNSVQLNDSVVIHGIHNRSNLHYEADDFFVDTTRTVTTIGGTIGEKFHGEIDLAKYLVVGQSYENGSGRATSVDYKRKHSIILCFIGAMLSSLIFSLLVSLASDSFGRSFANSMLHGFPPLWLLWIAAKWRPIFHDESDSIRSLLVIAAFIISGLSWILWNPWHDFSSVTPSMLVSFLALSIVYPLLSAIPVLIIWVWAHVSQ